MDSVGSAGLPCDRSEPAVEYPSDVLELGFGVLEAELAVAELTAGISEGFLKLNESSIDFCCVFFASLLLALPWLLGIFTGEPLMLTKALELPTDFLIGGFSPVTVADLLEATAL